MEGLTAPRGLIVDLITPLNSDESIDRQGLGKLLERMIPHAQAIFLASPQTGEGKNLSLAQRLELLEKALPVIRGRVPLFIWISRETKEETTQVLLAFEKILEAQKYKGDIFWVDTPLYYHSNRGLPAHYRHLCAGVNQPFILTNDPGLIDALPRPLKRNNIRTALLKELSTLEGIAGLIFQGALDRAHHYERACRKRPRFKIYDGDETHFLDHPSMSGVVSVGANLAPKAWGWVVRSSLQMTGDQNNYPDYLQQVWETGGYLRRLKNTYGRVPVGIVKGVLSDMGVIETPTCTFQAGPMRELQGQVKEIVRHLGDYPEKT
jgi:dihydrodipicolinate synthase/N-acetylneuraminate lyase